MFKMGFLSEICSHILDSYIHVSPSFIFYKPDSSILLFAYLNLILLVWLHHLKFTLFIYSYPVFGAPTAPRAFELLTHFKRSQFGTDLRQCSCFSDFFLFSFFFYHRFYFLYFVIDLNGEMLTGQNEPHDYSAESELSVSETKWLNWWSASLRIARMTQTFHLSYTYHCIIHQQAICAKVTM